MFRICVDFRRLTASMTALHNFILELQIAVTKAFGLLKILTNVFWSEKCFPNITLPHRQHIMITVHVYASIKDVLILR